MFKITKKKSNFLLYFYNVNKKKLNKLFSIKVNFFRCSSINFCLVSYTNFEFSYKMILI